MWHGHITSSFFLVVAQGISARWPSAASFLWGWSQLKIGCFMEVTNVLVKYDGLAKWRGTKGTKLVVDHVNWPGGKWFLLQGDVWVKACF